MSNASASVELTIDLPSNGRTGSSTGSLPVASRIAFASSVVSLSDPLTTTLPWPAMRPAALDGRDLVLLEEIGDAVGVAFDDLVLAGQHGGKVEADVADLDAVTAEVSLGLGVDFAGIEHRLAGDAADVEAGAAQRGPLLDAGDLHAELGRADGGDVAAGAGADHHQVVTLGH